MYVRAVIVILLLAILGVASVKIYHAGEHHVQTKWDLAKARDAESIRIVEADNHKRSELASGEAIREQSARTTAAVRTANVVSQLQHLIAEQQITKRSLEAEVKHSATLGKLLGECSERYAALAGNAQGHVIDLRRFSDSWPTCSPTQ